MSKLLKVIGLTVVSVMLFSVTTYAATLSDPAANADASNRTVTVSGTVSDAADNQQVVILVLKDTATLTSMSDSDIAYIDQLPAEDDGSYSFSFGIDASKGNGFVAYVGGTEVSAVESASFSLGVTNGPGDANGDKKVNLDDYMVVINAFGSVDGDDNYDSKADLEADSKINLDDYMVVINNFGNVY